MTLHCRKLIFFFSLSRCQLKIISCLGERLSAKWPISVLGFLSTFELVESCDCCRSLCVFVCASVLLYEEDATFWGHPPFLARIIFSTSVSQISLVLKRKNLMKTSQLARSSSKSLIVWLLPSCGSLC